MQSSGHSAPERGSSPDSLTTLHSRLIQVKRDFRDIKMATEKQLDDVKSKLNFVYICCSSFNNYIFVALDDFNSTGRELLSACVNVCARSVTDSSDGAGGDGGGDPPSEGARGGTFEMQFERVRLEKQLLEKTSATLEQKNRLVVATNDQLNRSNRELREEVRTLRLDNDQLRGQVRRRRASPKSPNETQFIPFPTE